MRENLLLMAVGLLAGILSGLFGIGGGLVIVPALVIGFGFPQHKALGTSLGALLLPVGALGAWEYWRHGDVDVRIALVLALGLFIGAYFGAKVSLSMSPMILRRVYGVFLLAMGAKFVIAG